MTDTPQLYLMTPAGAQASALGPLLTEVMDRFPPACLRIRASWRSARRPERWQLPSMVPAPS